MTTPDYDTNFYQWTQAQADALRAKETGLLLATFPEACPWSLAQVLAEDFWPEAP
jgi:hypothetical protein